MVGVSLMDLFLFGIIGWCLVVNELCLFDVMWVLIGYFDMWLWNNCVVVLVVNVCSLLFLVMVVGIVVSDVCVFGGGLVFFVIDFFLCVGVCWFEGVEVEVIVVGEFVEWCCIFGYGWLMSLMDECLLFFVVLVECEGLVDGLYFRLVWEVE